MTETTDIPRGYCQCGCGGETTRIEVTNRPQGRIKGEFNRFIVGHGRRIREEQHYGVDPETGCWVWQHGRAAYGYGVLTINGRYTHAHRHYYTLHKGPIPSGHHVHHRCENPPCVNPDHLEALSPSDHMKTMTLARGERGGKAKLTESEVLQIRTLFDQEWLLADIGRAFGVAYTTIRAIGRRTTWAHVPEAGSVA